MHVYFDGFSICENKVVVVTAVAAAVGVVVGNIITNKSVNLF